MIAHQAIRPYRNPIFLTGGPEVIQISQPILVREKDVHATVAALHNVVRILRNNYAGHARRHEQITKDPKTWYEPCAEQKQWTAPVVNGNNIV
jgi:hypothetical protein